MDNRGFTGVVYNTSDWLMKFAMINLFWVLLTICGLGLFGLFPATIAMFDVISKLRKKEEFPIFKTFCVIYKKEFIKGNIMGMILIVIGTIFYLDLYFVQRTSNQLFQVLFYPLVILNFIFYICVLYVFPIYTHYQLKIAQILKNAFLIMIANPIATIAMISSVTFVVVLTMILPATLLFFSGSILAFFITSIANSSFQKIEQKKIKYKNIR
ncbi:YesL family protein [Bacillus sp. 1P02SD]|uniref:YesL family protein n=1 Tax=Bacillus sp. 1P02SD TaxID=3132264 RepID=UPI0039A2A61D